MAGTSRSLTGTGFPEGTAAGFALTTAAAKDASCRAGNASIRHSRPWSQIAQAIGPGLAAGSQPFIWSFERETIGLRGTQARRETAAAPAPERSVASGRPYFRTREARGPFVLLGISKLSAAIGKVWKSQIRTKTRPRAPQSRARDSGIDRKSGEQRQLTRPRGNRTQDRRHIRGSTGPQIEQRGRRQHPVHGVNNGATHREGHVVGRRQARHQVGFGIDNDRTGALVQHSLGLGVSDGSINAGDSRVPGAGQRPKDAL
jgi:hypothetical protein